MVENFDQAELYEGIFRDRAAGIATIPFSFHRFPTKLGHERNVTGDIIYREVYDYYYEESGSKDAWPAWEMNDYDTVQGTGRFPLNLSNIFFMINLLLPGTSIIYYGDEIGMNSKNFTLQYTDVRDPYSKEPYCNQTKYENGECICRDASRTPMQWTNGVNAGFTNATEGPWLPINENDYEIFNVDYQQDFHLQSFRNISLLRETNAFKYGGMYFPYHDENIFSFLRKDPDDDIAYLAVINIGQKGENQRYVDFTSAMPDFPSCGTLVASTDLTDVEHLNHTHGLSYGSRIPMYAVELDPYEGFVIELDFGQDEDEGCTERTM